MDDSWVDATRSVVDYSVASAAVPGAVLGYVDDGRFNYIDDLNDLERGEIAGYNSRPIGRDRQLYPRLSKVDYDLLLLQRLPEVHGFLETLLARVGIHEGEVRETYLAERKAVEQVMADGRKRVIMIARCPEAATELQILEAEAAGEVLSPTGPVYSTDDLAGRPKRREYSLTQLWNDEDALNKFPVSYRTIETCKKMSATNPDAAARVMQQAMNQCQDRIAATVHCGNSFMSKGAARNTIKQFSRYVKRDGIQVHCDLIMDQLFMYGPGGDKDWHVRGPIKNANELSYLYWFAREHGYIHASILLSTEIVMLGFNIGTAYDESEPTLIHFSGLPEVSPRAGMAPETSARISVAQRGLLEAAHTRMTPIVGADGLQLATAVRVTGNYVLVNPHVAAADPTATVSGDPLVARAQIASDLWAVKCVGDAEPWHLRSPEKGEIVVVCYLASLGVPSVSNPLKIVNVNTTSVITTLDSELSYGTSGGALVSLSDGALLGVLSGSTRTNLVAARFGETEFANLVDADSLAAYSRHGEVASFAANVIERFEKRGISRVFKRAVDSMDSVYVDGQHVGMAAYVGDSVYTACDPEMPLRVGSGGSQFVFERVAGSGLYRSRDSVGVASSAFVRPPNFHEKVFVLGFDTESYISEETRVVHVGVGAKTFVLADLPALDKPVVGGLVMAWDGAILGCCGPRRVDTPCGVGFTCWSLPRWSKPDIPSPRESLQKLFPGLNLGAWPDELLSEVFTHTSVGKYKSGAKVFNAGPKPLANIGDSVARTELFVSLRDHDIPHSTWQLHLQKLQSNAAMAETVWALGLHELMIVSEGVVMGKGSKSHADMLEALVGAASLVEKTSVVHDLCLSLNLIYQSKDAQDIDEGHVDDYDAG